MKNKSYKLRYLSLFEQDLINTVNYIANVLMNEDAAKHLVDEIEAAILKRLDNPVAFEQYYNVTEGKADTEKLVAAFCFNCSMKKYR